MNKLKMQSPDMIQKNIDRIAELFPNVITEKKDENGVLKKVINFEKLKQELADEVIDGEESYDFTWVGKKASIIEANTPIRKTLRPCIEESKDWETTGNLYIEGDNLDVLKLLQESYLNSIKMIYIDPPYNTGSDFIYKDNFASSKDEYEEDAGTFDEEGNRLFRNTETNGRYHSDWCSMLYPRLKLAYNLLREDGMIFISIDDNEVYNLRKICNEIFGEENFIDSIIWKKKYGGGAKEKYLVSVHEYIFVYAKNLNQLPEILVEFEDEKAARFYKNKDDKFETLGYYRTHPLEAVKSFDVRANLNFPVIAPDGKEVWPKRQWRWSKERFTEALSKNEVIFSKNKDDEWVLSSKQYLNNEDGTQRKTKAQSLIDDVFTQEGTREIEEIFGDAKIFSFPKPSRLIRKLVEIGGLDSKDLILDFFSGSASTANAVMQVNAEYASEGLFAGNRNYIMVQLPEQCDNSSEAFKSGYKNICEIGKERIRRTGNKIKTELDAKSDGKLDFYGDSTAKPESLDIGFRVLKVDSTNMKDVYYAANEYDHNQLDMFESNIKDDRTPLDLLYQCLLDWGLSLSLPHTIEKIDKVSVHTVDNGSLVACFDNNVPESVVREIAKRKPLRVVFKDSSFNDSPSKINVSEIFKTLAPGTTVKVI